MNTEIVRQEDVAVEVSHGWTPVALRAQIERERELRLIIIEYYQSCMIEGHHYYRLDDDDKKKPALSKEGALNLCNLFKVRPDPDPPIEIWGPNGHYTVRYRTRLVSLETGELMAIGDGLCSTRESKYAYRYVARVCPACGKAAIIKGHEKYGGGWLCFRKKEGCGAKFRDGDLSIESQVTGRVPNEDLADQANTVLKMSEKRSLVDGALKLPLASELFIQDLEEQLTHRQQESRGLEVTGEIDRQSSAVTITKVSPRGDQDKVSAGRREPPVGERIEMPQDDGRSDHPTAEQITSLAELIRACGLDADAQLREILSLPHDARVPRKIARETMTMRQYDTAWQFYSQKLKAAVDADGSGPEQSQPPSGDAQMTDATHELSQDTDVPPGQESPVDDPPAAEGSGAGTAEPSPSHEPDGTETSEGTGDRKHATAQQISRLKLLAKQVGDDAYADVQDVIEHSPQGLLLEVYDVIKGRLQKRKDEAKSASAGELA